MAAILFSNPQPYAIFACLVRVMSCCQFLAVFSALMWATYCQPTHTPINCVFHSLLVASIMSVGEQALEDDPGVAPFLCGFTVGDDALAPGGEEWFTLTVDEKICSVAAYFSMISMLGELCLVLHNTLYTHPTGQISSPALSKTQREQIVVRFTAQRLPPVVEKLSFEVRWRDRFIMCASSWIRWVCDMVQ